MTTTSPLILFGATALEILGDIDTIENLNGTLQPFSDLDDLREEIAHNKYVTFEPDMWLMDGTYKFMPAPPRVGWMTTDMAVPDEVHFPGSPYGFFSSSPQIRITFSTPHDLSSMTFYFSETGDYPILMNLIARNSVGGLIENDELNPDSQTYVYNHSFAGVKTLDISMSIMSKQYRFARLMGIDFDTVTRFDGEQIKSAKLVEAISPISAELPINTLDFTLISPAGDFNVVAPAGVYADLQENQPIEAYENVDGSLVYLGRFYLDEWESKSANEALFRTIDAVGLMDKTQIVDEDATVYALNTIMFSGNSSGTVIQYLMAYMGLNYELDASLNSITLKGWIGQGTIRDAMHQIALAIGGYVTCARSKVVRIVPTELASDLAVFDYTLTGANKGITSPITLKPLVSGVELVGTGWNPEGVTSDIFSESLAVGTYLIKLPNPVYYVAGLGGLTSNWNVISFTLAAPATVTLTAERAVSNVRTYSVYASPLPSNPKIIGAGDAKFVPSYQVAAGWVDPQEVAQRIYDYHQQRFIQKTKLFASLIAPGNSALVDAQGGQIGGIVERMSTNLIGMVQDVEIVGVVVP